jgi:WD40 repeat protein
LWLASGSTLLWPQEQKQGGSTPVYRSLAFSPDGKLLAAGSGGILFLGQAADPGSLAVWNIASRRPRFSQPEKTGISSVAFSPDGKLLAAGTFSDVCKVLDTATGKVKMLLPGHGQAARAVAFAPDGKTLATGSYDSKIRLWDLATSTLAMTLEGHTERVFRLAFSPDGALLASSSGDHSVRLWDLKSGKLVHTLLSHQSEVYTIAFVARSGWLASIGWDYSVRFHSVTTGQQLARVEQAGSEGLVLTGDGATLATCGSSPFVKLYKVACRDANSSERKHIQSLITLLDDDSFGTREKASEELLHFGWLAEPYLSTALKESKSAEVRIRARRLTGALRAPQPAAVLRGHQDEVRCLALSPDGRTLASAGKDPHICLWDLGTRKKRGTLPESQPAAAKPSGQ